MSHPRDLQHAPILLKYLSPDEVRDHLDSDPRLIVPVGTTVLKYHRGVRGAIPADSPGSLGRPTLASREQGERLYHSIYDRIATRVFGRGAEA